MRVAIIGADRLWGALLAAELGAGLEVVALGAAETSDLAGYRQVDLLQREALDPVLRPSGSWGGKPRIGLRPCTGGGSTCLLSALIERYLSQ